MTRGFRLERVASHQGQPYFQDALAALQNQQAGNYVGDEELVELYERAAPLLTPLVEDSADVAGAFRAAGLNADAMKHFNEGSPGRWTYAPFWRGSRLPPW